MRMFYTCINRSTVVAVFALATCLAGCASKNPLMEEPAGAQPVAAKQETPAVVTDAQPAAPSDANTGSGVHTIRKSRFLGIFSPYRVNVQQGNFISREMVSQLKQGMTPDQVRFVLGTPLSTDIFHAERWDYPFRLQKSNGEIITSRVTVYFKDGLLSRFEGGDLLTEKDYLALIAGKPPAVKSEPAAPSPKPASEARQQ